ncbi:MAG: RNase adapter RapZ, partial [Planctomycetota bacterium]
LADVAPLAHRIDTSDLSVSALRMWIKDLIGQDRSRITLLFQSFGFKHGIPLDADLVFDVRCLPNPHYVAELRPLTGRDQPVKDYLEASPNAMAMLADIRAYVENWLPCFIQDHRSYLTVAIGCTGGQHRSVYFAETLAAAFRAREQVLVRHRELA